MNTAVAWWIDTGVHFKMASDVSAKYGSLFNFWERPKIRDNIPLDFSHVGTAIITFGVTSFLSIIAFVLEITYVKLRMHKKRQRRQKKRQRKGLRAQPRPTFKPKKDWVMVDTNVSWWHPL